MYWSLDFKGRIYIKVVNIWQWFLITALSLNNRYAKVSSLTQHSSWHDAKIHCFLLFSEFLALNSLTLEFLDLHTVDSGNAWISIWCWYLFPLKYNLPHFYAHCNLLCAALRMSTMSPPPWTFRSSGTFPPFRLPNSPKMFETLKFLPPANTPLNYTYKMLKYTARLSHFAPTCFGPPGPSSGSLCRNLLKLQFCGDSQ